jgi:hypothetical protein
MTTTPDLDAAARFLEGNGRVLDKRRFDVLFRRHESGPVRDAVAAFANADGGFGHGLEPDLRGPASQPAAAEMALRILDEADAWDRGLVLGACEWLERNASPGGGVTFVLESALDWPHAPWWVPVDGRPTSPIQTGMIAGTLHSRQVDHPWLTQATEVMWEQIGALTKPGPYDMFGVLRFLDCVPDRKRAERAFETVAPLLRDPAMVELDPNAAGEVHGPLSFAARPDSLARQVFDQATIDAHLDHLAKGQEDDGGWTFNWPQWSQAGTLDWRGFLTVDALVVLRANGRL